MSILEENWEKADWGHWLVMVLRSSKEKYPPNAVLPPVEPERGESWGTPGTQQRGIQPLLGSAPLSRKTQT